MGRKAKRAKVLKRIERLNAKADQPIPVSDNSVMQEKVKEQKIDVAPDTSFTPDIVEDFPHFHYFRYFAGHHLLVVAIIYAVVVFKLKPTLISLKKAFIALNVFLVIALFANLILDANYFWIMEKPPAGSLLDYMGPWPWYILTGEFVALAHFILAYLLFLLIDKINVRS